MALALKIPQSPEPVGFLSKGPAALSLVATEPAVPYGLRWLDLDLASKRSGIPVRTLSRRCGVEWFAAGKAKMISPGKGERPRWHIREDADPALMPAKFPDQMPFDPMKLNAAQRRTVNDRKAVLDGWRPFVKQGRKLEEKATAEYLAIVESRYGLRVSRRTLFRWEKCYRAGGLAGLIDGRGNGGSAGPDASDPFFQQVQRLYLQPRRLKLSQCHELAGYLAAEHGFAPRSYKQCQRFIEKLPPGVVYRYRGGDEAFTNKAEPYIERDYSTLASNEIWCGDHHRLDVIVNDGGKLLRPWLTAWMDMRSRKIVGWQLFGGDPCTDTILAAFADGARSHGLPEGVYIDNGKDYDSRALHGRTKRQRQAREPIDQARAGGVFSSLDVKATFCWKYHGQSKPIERFFRDLAYAAKVWATYTGNTTANKPENLSQQLKKGNAPALDEMREWTAAWLATHHARPHTGDSMDGQSPDQVFAANLRTRRTCAPELLAVLLMKQTRPVKVGRNGVRWQGLTYGWCDAALNPWLGKEVVLRVDPKDVTYVLVMTPDDKLICRAAVNEKLPFNASEEQRKAAIAEKKRRRKVTREYFQTGPRMVQDIPELMILAAAQKALPSPDAPAPQDQHIRTASDGELAALRRTSEPGLRIAAGAEDMSPPQRFTYQRASDQGDGDRDDYAPAPFTYERRPDYDELRELLRQDDEPAPPKTDRMAKLRAALHEAAKNEPTEQP